MKSIDKHIVPLTITQNGETRPLIRDIESCEQNLETQTFLKILALGNQQIQKGKAKPASEVFRKIRNQN